MKNRKGHFPECDSYVCEGCPRQYGCEFAEVTSRPWAPLTGALPDPVPRQDPPTVGGTDCDCALCRRAKVMRDRMCLVYIAGPLSGREVQYLENVARMLQVWRKLVEAGYACVCPAADLLLGLVSPFAWPASMYKKQSMELLRRCDVVFVTNPADITPGVAAEIAEAERLQIPVAYSVEMLPGVTR